MKSQSRKGIKVSRRNILPILGSSFLIPFLGFGNTGEADKTDKIKSDEYQTLLKADGTTVRVKVSTIKKSKIVQKSITNKSFLHWLGKKF